jgi:hypothetical protein
VVEVEGEQSPIWGGTEKASRNEDGLGSKGLSPKKAPTMLGNFTIYKVNREFEDF